MTTCLAPLAPAPALIPSLDGIPGEIVLRPESVFWANIALWCDEAGIVRESDWTQAKDAQSLAVSALVAWASQFVQMKHLGCSFVFDEADDHTFEYVSSFEDMARERGLNPGVPHIAVTIFPNGFEDRVIGERIVSVESACPGLGETALAAIGAASYRTVKVLDPAHAMYLASMTYWYGEADETMALEEIASMGEDPDSFGLVKKQDFLELAPEWAWHPGRKLGPKKLASIAKDNSRSPEVRRIAALCRDIFRYLAQEAPDQRGGMYDENWCGLAMALWWGHEPGCIMQRVWDDHYNQAMQGGESTEAFGVDLFEATPEGFKSWVEGKRTWLKLASLQDSLIDLISEEVKKV